MAIIYILKSKKTSKFYTGSSHFDDTSVRLAAHNGGKVRSTKAGRPWQLIFTENFNSYTDARKREIFLKTGVGRKWIYEHFRDKN